MKEIPYTNEFQTELGPILLSIYNGELDLNKEIPRWKRSKLISSFESLDRMWNNHFVDIFKGLFDKLESYNLPYTYFDGTSIFSALTPTEDSIHYYSSKYRPYLIAELYFFLYKEYKELTDSFATISSQLTQINNYTQVKTFLDLSDTPNSYTGQAGKYIGVDNKAKNITFLLPHPNTKLLDLTDTLDVYNVEDSFMVVNDAGNKIIESKTPITSSKFLNWKIVEYTCTNSPASTTFVGTQLDNICYLVSLLPMASCNAHVIKLGTTFHEARVCFKVIEGENLSSTKYLEGNTSGGVQFHEGIAPGLYQLNPAYAYTFIYDTSSSSFYKISNYPS